MMTLEQLCAVVSTRVPASMSDEVKVSHVKFIVTETLSQLNLAVNEFTGEIFDPTPKEQRWKSPEMAPLTLRDRQQPGDYEGRRRRRYRR